MILICNDFWHKREMYNSDPYNVLLSIATNIAVLLMTAFVLQGHKCEKSQVFMEIFKTYDPTQSESQREFMMFCM